MLKRVGRYLATAAEDAARIFFPPVCPLCGGTMNENEYFICTACRFRAPLTGFASQPDNPMAERMRNLLPVKHAAALMWFIEGSPWQRLIHDFKYNDFARFAYRSGQWLGGELSASGLYDDIDGVMFVPLHPLKRMYRGYDQSEIIAEGVASVMKRPVVRHALVRRVNNPSQSQNPDIDRWKNVEGIFHVRHPERLRGRHLLLVDDVFTTGATMFSCVESLLERVGDVAMSLAAVAVTQRGMAVDR